MISAERILKAIAEAEGHYANAARALRMEPDNLRSQMTRLRRKGYTFPPHTGMEAQNNCYEPTPAEIAAACLEIQRGWSEQTRRFRLVVPEKLWDVPRVELEYDSREPQW